MTAALSLLLGLLLLRTVSADNTLALYGYAAIFGIGFGGTFSMIQLALAEYFSGASAETDTEKCDVPFPSFSITYVLENGSISLCCTGASTLETPL